MFKPEAVVGREVGLTKADGGWGKEAMLMTLRIVLSGPLSPFVSGDDVERTVGTNGVELDV